MRSIIDPWCFDGFYNKKIRNNNNHVKLINYNSFEEILTSLSSKRHITDAVRRSLTQVVTLTALEVFSRFRRNIMFTINMNNTLVKC